MSTLVMKFGGTSVATPAHFARVADMIIKRFKEYSRIAVVVSAMANTTNHLIDLAKQVNLDPPRREYDMLVSVGERISISLLAMSLIGKQQQAISFTGSQSGIITCSQHTDARILEVRPHRILPHLEAGKVVIVAGFQGVSESGEITTLGRGGSDTTAVALALALDADLEFIKDVGGIFDQDPKLHPQAKLFPKLSYQDAFEIMQKGAGVLHPRCIQLAWKNSIPMNIMSFDTEMRGTIICDPILKKTTQPLYENG